jgi:hypothetical protein
LIPKNWETVLNSDAFKKGHTDRDASEDNLSIAVDLVHLMLGRAISDWGQVEKELSSVFVNCFPIMHSAPAGHAFFEPRSFQTQLNMTSRAVVIACQKSPISKEMTERWREIFKTTEKLSFDRNKLAHGSVICDQRFEDNYFFVRFEAFASASIYNSAAVQNLEKKDAKKHWQTIPNIFTGLELNNLAADFNSASELLREFSRDLSDVHNDDGTSVNDKDNA